MKNNRLILISVLAVLLLGAGSRFLERPAKAAAPVTQSHAVVVIEAYDDYLPCPTCPDGNPMPGGMSVYNVSTIEDPVIGA